MKQAQREATQSAIAAKPCPVILAIGNCSGSSGLLGSNLYATVYEICFQTDFGGGGVTVDHRIRTGDTMPPCRGGN